MLLEHVNVTVSDVERSAEFYCELLGVRVRWRGKNTSGADAVHVGDDQSYVAFFQGDGDGNGRTPPDYTSVGLNHFGFVVNSLDDAKRTLANFGLTPHAEQDYEPGRRIYFFDHDGVEVELVEYDS